MALDFQPRQRPQHPGRLPLGGTAEAVRMGAEEEKGQAQSEYNE